MTIIFDLDGTLALIDHRRHWLDKAQHPDLNSDARWRAFYAACVDDEPNAPVIAMLKILRQHFNIAIFSARSSEVREQTLAWFAKHEIEYDVFKMRNAGDHTPDRELKAQWLAEFGKEKIFCVFDDRSSVVDMWRDQGLACFQVAKGDF